MSSLKINHIFWIRALLVGTLLSTVLISMFMNQDRPCFRNDLPNHFSSNAVIIAIEFADTLSEFEQILNTQGPDCNDQASDRIRFLKKSIYLDFGYILSYGLFFFFLIINLGRQQIRLIHRFLICIIILICLFDVGENIFLLKALEAFSNTRSNIDQQIMIMFNFAVLKWSFLFFFILGTLYLSAKRMKPFVRNSLLLFYFTFLIFFALFPFLKLPLIGNAVQLIILASLPILLWSFLRALGNK